MKNLLRISLMMMVLLGVCVKSFSAEEQKPLPGEGAAITFFGQGEIDTLRPGVTIFSDRPYKVKECPEWLQGKKFLRNSIDDDRLNVTADGVLTILTAMPKDNPRSTRQCKILQSHGFFWVNQPELFRLFDSASPDLVGVYQKQVKKGDQLSFGKWTVVLGFKSAVATTSGGLWWDPEEKIFKLWYNAGWYNTLAYATSKDGLKWERPSLDVNPGTNQVLPVDLKVDSWTVVPDREAKDPQQRYKMFAFPVGGVKGVKGVRCGLSMTSTDGIHWINRTATGHTEDRSTMFYNPFRKKWVYTLRTHFRGRSAHYRECDDFLEGAKWKGGEPVAWAAADRDDPINPSIGCRPQLYALNAIAYESILLGSYEIHHGPPNPELMEKGLPKITGVNFAYSRDGFHWSRPDRRIHIPSEQRDVWDRGYVQPIGNLCCIRGERLWFYYSGFQGNTNQTEKTHPTVFDNGMYDRGAIGLAFLRRDGFVSMEAWAKPGTLTTRPVVFGGKQVFVNTATPLGELRVEILDESGKPIAPFTLENCQPISCDSTLQQVTWKGADSVASLNGKPVRFRFTLQDGALYAFWVSRDASGRSDGYVAGGGPGFTGMTDTVGRAALQAEQNYASSPESVGRL